MPVRDSSNNRILPPNSRAADVATRTLNELIPVQQAKYLNAFRVQGYQGILYNKSEQGKRCTCQSSQKALNHRLDKDGKASKGDINRLLTGDATFDITPYGQENWKDAPPGSDQTSPLAPTNKYQGEFSVVMDEGDYPGGEIVSGQAFGDNGPIDTEVNIEDIFGDFDASAIGISDVRCGVCFGTGFIGGYSPFHANRQVYIVTDVLMDDSEINFLKKPWTARSSRFFINALFPFGAIGFDAFRVMDNATQLPATFKVDDVPIRTFLDVLKFCDGRMHQIEVNMPSAEWTHVELQFNLTYESTFFEFPKLTKSNDTALLEQFEPFQIIVSPNVPSLKTEDIIVESTMGKVLVVQNSSWWNTRNRNVLGWETMVRVIQPQELWRILPHRGRVMTKPPTTNTVHDNSTGPRRT